MAANYVPDSVRRRRKGATFLRDVFGIQCDVSAAEVTVGSPNRARRVFKDVDRFAEMGEGFVYVSYDDCLGPGSVRE